MIKKSSLLKFAEETAIKKIRENEKILRRYRSKMSREDYSKLVHNHTAMFSAFCDLEFELHQIHVEYSRPDA